MHTATARTRSVYYGDSTLAGIPFLRELCRASCYGSGELRAVIGMCALGIRQGVGESLDIGAIGVVVLWLWLLLLLYLREITSSNVATTFVVGM